jgi:hypothetical protein
MRRALLCLLSTTFVLGLANASRAADDVKDIVNKAIKAHGGKEAMTKYKAGKMTAKGTLSLPGVGDVEITQTVAYMLPDKLKEEMELEVAGNKIKTLTVMNGDKVSIEANGTKIPITDAIKKALQDAKHLLKVTRLVPLVEDKGFTLDSLGEIKVEGKPAVGVRASFKGQKDINVYFYKDSHLLAKMEYRSSDPMTEMEFTEERIISEYQKEKKGGVAVPKTAIVNRDGKKFLKAEVETEYLEKLDDSEFKKGEGF